MSAWALGLLLNFAPPPAPPLPEVDEDDDASSEDAPAPDANAPSGPPAPPVSDVEPGADEASDVPSAPSGRDEPTPLVARPGSRVEDEVPRDEYGEPVMEYGEPAGEGEALRYAEDDVQEPELEFASDEDMQQPELGYSDETKAHPAPDDAALERQRDDPFAEGAAGANGSPQRFAMELKFGPYLPSIDRRWDGDGYGPYATIFGRTDGNGVVNGEPKKGLFSVLSFEWQFYNLAGPFSIGTTVGFFQDKAQSLLAQPDDEGNVRSSADRARFNIVPITLLLGYRFELLADEYRVPLVPYVRAGLGYGFWWSTGGDGELSKNSEGVKGRGGSLGWQANLGLMLRLDWISRETARNLDEVTGINHTYVFGEWQFSHLDGFGSDKRMAVGDDTFTVGLAVEF